MDKPLTLKSIMPLEEPEFPYDAFVSYSSKDKAAVREIAGYLRDDGLRVWFDEWEIHAGDSIPAKIEEGLEHSRVLVLCMSVNAFGSDWAQLEAGTFRFRDPLNKTRRFIPLRLDETPVKGSLAQFLFIDWRAKDRNDVRTKLSEACRPMAPLSAMEAKTTSEDLFERSAQLDCVGSIWAYAFSPDGRLALSNGKDKAVRLWNLETGLCERVLSGHTSDVETIAWSSDGRRALTGGQSDHEIRLWDIKAESCVHILKGHHGAIHCLAFSSDLARALSGGEDGSLRLWDLKTGLCLQIIDGHNAVRSLAWSIDQHFVLSGTDDNILRLWDLKTRQCVRSFEGHSSWISSLAWSADQRFAVSGSFDRTLRFWDVQMGGCRRVFEGHTGLVDSVTLSADLRHTLSSSQDKTVRLWDVETGHCLHVFQGHTERVWTVSFGRDGLGAVSGDTKGDVRLWDLSGFGINSEILHDSAPKRSLSLDQVQYTNAKVLLVGDSGAGKTGLSKVLAGEKWQATDSTVGAWATHWKLPLSSVDGIEREIWLWDFGGQADQRLIHQLYMEETALAVLVFDGQKEDLFDTLGQWDRDLSRATGKKFAKVLVAGRVDAGALRVSRNQIETFAKERGFKRVLETSAKTGIGCEELEQVICNSIQWENIPWRSSPRLFKRLREEIILLKDAGRVLVRFNELRETLQLRLGGENARFSDDELHTVIRLLAGPGVLWELEFGSWILLQPERINAYAQAVIQTMRADGNERGCLSEERVLRGDLIYQSSAARIGPDEERIVLLAMHQTLVERGLCLRENTDKGSLLVFPSYYRRERPDLVGHPAVLVSYRFNGFLDDIYATLVVRLHHMESFEQDELWRYAADFKTLTGKQLGVKLARRGEGAGELDVYFDPTIPLEEQIIFSKYVHEHLLQRAQNVVRLRHYVCPHCGTPVENHAEAMKRLNAWFDSAPENPLHALLFVVHVRGFRTKLPTILCVGCEKRVPLWDKMEELFASSATKQRVSRLLKQSEIVLDNESKDRALVGEVISTVALAGQISRELSVSDHGIDMEIEFKSDTGEATGRKLYLQLKSGDSYLRKRRRDDAEVFDIKNERHARYWAEQAFPVMLIIRRSSGEVHWMEVGELLKNKRSARRIRVTNIVFVGERFDVMSVRRWRDMVLDQEIEESRASSAVPSQE